MARRTEAFETAAPESVRIMHKLAGNSHIFTSPDMDGLHIGHPDLKTAFSLIPGAVSGIVRGMYDIQVVYKTTVTFDEFVHALEGEAEHDFSNLLAPSFCAIINHNKQLAA